MASPLSHAPRPLMLSQPLPGGILLNGDGPAPLAPPGQSGAGQGRERGRPAAIITSRSSATSRSPAAAIGSTADSHAAAAAADAASVGNNGSSSPRIRFAPLPDPALMKPRSLSTGRNVGLTAAEGPNGEREYNVELHYGDHEHALDDGDDSDEYDYDPSGRRRSWVPSMGSVHLGSMASVGSWMGGKKLLGKPKEGSGDDYGAPLKKSVSAGSMSGTSPFRLAADGGKKSLLSTSPSSSVFGGLGSNRRPSASVPQPNAHRRGGSGDAGASALATSAPKVRMLNGRVYGARRASEAAAAEEMRRRRLEPEFVEWGSGHGAAPASVGSSSVPRRSNDPDDDDGGGMAWVRRRREERERREREEKEAKEKEDEEKEDAAEASADFDVGPMGERLEPSTGSAPAAAVSPSDRPASLSSSASSSPAPANGPLTPHEAPVDLGTFPPVISITPPVKRHATPVGENAHVVQAIAIPGSEKRMARRADSEDGDEEEEDEDDGDFDDDDEEEEEMGTSRLCSEAAGVEILSRHKSP